MSFACGDSGGSGSPDGSDGPTCIDTLPETCAAPYPATWDNVYRFVVAQRCSSGGSNCHGSQGLQGNLALHDKDGAYRALLGMDGTHPRVMPLDPACSVLMERLTTPDDSRRMPIGGRLSEGELCAVQTWIEQGAMP